MCKILLSIHPEFVNGIINGIKTYELRRKLPSRKVDKIVIYSTSPVKKVLCEVDVEDIITDCVDKLWKIVGEYVGIDYDTYKKYFKELEYANAFKIGKIYKFEEPKSLSEYGIKNA